MRSERREQFREAERENPAIAFRLLKEIKRKAGNVGSRGPKDHYEISAVSVVPDFAEAPLIGVAKSDVIFEWDDFKAALTNAVNDTLLGQQLVGIGHYGQTGDAGEVATELDQN